MSNYKTTALMHCVKEASLFIDYRLLFAMKGSIQNEVIFP